MKRNILCIIMAMLSIGMVFSQEQENEVTRRGYMTVLAVSPEEDTHSNALINDILQYDIDPTEFLSPNLLRIFANFSIRRVTYGKREIYFNEKLITLLQSMYDNVGSLTDTHKYVTELRIIINESKNLYVLSNAMAAYGAIIEKNTPKTADFPAYSPKRLYLLDTLHVLVRVSAFNSNDNQSSHLVRLATPTIRKILRDDRTVTVDEFFQRDLYYISTYYKSRVSSNNIKKIIGDVIKIEIEEEMKSR